MHLGIDFGTSSTAAVLTGAGGTVTPLLFDGSPLLPSAVHLDVAAGVLAVGGDAVRGGALDPGRCEPHPKLRAADGTVPLGGTGVPVEHLFAAVLWAVHAEALRVTGGTPPHEVALTHPASWDTHHRGALLTAASMAGLPAATLVPSPVAVARAVLGRLPQPAAAGVPLVVYELGAATFEVTVLRVTAAGPQVLATAGLTGVGGLDLDLAIAEHLLIMAPGPARAAGPGRPLLEQARLAKELLSAGTSAVVPVAGRGEVTLTPQDLDTLATPLLRPTAELTLRTMRDAGVDAAPAAVVYLAGGATRLPLVAALLHRVAGVAPVALDRPEFLAVEGSVAVLAAGGGGPAPAVEAGAAVPGGGGGGGAAGGGRGGAVLTAGHAEPVPAPAVPVPAVPVPAVPAGDDGGPLWGWLPRPGAFMPGEAWREAPFQPLQLALPSGSGWTIRARFADRTVFLGRGGGPLLFRSVDGLAGYLLNEPDHELAALAGWARAREPFVAFVRGGGDEEQVDLDLVQYNLGYPPQQWMPDLLIAARDVAVELAEAFALDDVGALLAEGGLLDLVDELLRDADRAFVGRSARRRLDTLDADAVRHAWHAVVTRLDDVAAWAD
ncbi:Hsp70 family protein [Dactylosporangium aurantiacum]|uniref:Hsp70 family protein n=1 Tax=Dactylosporangium aurantiacum TaxID=35754 RepID=A0A9Q9MBN8_9ACTN|nr:Hsp70 family protein [Dactylosporangium aurantiacum]MDG6102620.1 Hsp70 family protein [Dactylosporangium aurantiacum]UWZ53123.1 Hsp70 family protein [Dactylosporangium aurantiacum]